MSSSANLFVFFMLVFGIIVLPGMDMAFVLASALTGGRKSGLSAVAGIMAGGTVHMAIGVLGVAVVLQALPQAFNFVLLCGGAYLAWIGLTLLRLGVRFEAAGQQRTPAAHHAFFRGMLTNLLNPKAYLFMLAVFPQFVRPNAGPLWLQAIPMSCIILCTQAAVYGPLALMAARSSAWLQQQPVWNARIGKLVGGTLLILATATVARGWRLA